MFEKLGFKRDADVSDSEGEYKSFTHESGLKVRYIFCNDTFIGKYYVLKDGKYLLATADRKEVYNFLADLGIK